jgi:hypothetical protein
MIRNKWKWAFWICFIVLIFISGLSIYSIIDQGVTITYMREGYENTENDLNSVIEIINKNDLSRTTIRENLKAHRFYDNMDFTKDSIGLERVILIFENDTLKSIVKQW